MECEKCKKQFERPLELYNGDWACPVCHASLALNSLKIVVTDENESVFKMSEICYLKALKCTGDKKNYNKFLSRAIEYCKDAAHSGHPKALVRLGYLYDAGYFSVDSSEAFKMAYEYYRAVWNGIINDMRGAKTDGAYESGGLQVKKSAARLYLNLLKNAPPKMRAHQRYRYESELSAVLSSGLAVEAESFGEAATETDRCSKIYEILESCFSKERAPLFGLILIDSAEFKELTSVNESAKNGTRKKLIHIAEKVTLRLIDIRDGNSRAIKNARDLQDVQSGTYCLYFFNTNGRHTLSYGNINAVKRALEKGDALTEFVKINELIGLICNSDYTDYVFSDDDIIVHKSKAESIAHALSDMIKTVQNNIKRGEN